MPTLFLLVVVDLIGFGIVIPLLPFYGLRHAASPEMVALLMASFSLAQFVAAPLWGRLSDRVGRRPVLLVSTAGAVLSYLVLAWAPSLLVLFLARILAGITAGNIAAAQAYIADVTPESGRARGMGLIGAAFGIGFILGPAIGGLLAGADPAAPDVVAPALAAAGLAGTAFLGVLFLLPESLTPERRARNRAVARPGRLAAARAALAETALAPLIGLGFALVFVFAGMESVFALWSIDTLGWGPAQNGYLFAFLGLASALVQGLAIGGLIRRFGETRLTACGLLLMALGLAGIAASASVPPLVAAAAAIAIGYALANPSLTSLVSRAAGDGAQGTVLGVYQSASSLARVFGPAGAGLAFGQLGPSWPFLLGALVLVPAVFVARGLAARDTGRSQPAAPRPVAPR